MQHPAMPSTDREANAPTVNPSPDAPVMTASERAAQHVGDARETLALARLATDAGVLDPGTLRFLLGQLGGQLRNTAALLRAGAAVLALAAVATVLPVGGAPHAEAAVIWSPPLVHVTVDRPSVRFSVPVMVDWANVAGLYSASVWLPRGGQLVLGGVASSRTGLTLSVPVVVDARTFPVGRSKVWVQDDADGDLRPVVVEALRPSRVLRPFVADALAGRLYVAVSVQHYSPAGGTWTGSKLSPLQVQVLHGRTWRTVATITSDTTGHAYGFVPVGAGRWYVRLVRPQGATVGAAVSPVVRVTVTPGAVDVE